MRIDRKCSVNLSARRRFVSPMYNTSHLVHWIQYITLVVVHVYEPLMVMMPLGPVMMLVEKTWAHVLHLDLLHGEVLGVGLLSMLSLIDEWTSWLRRLQSFLYAERGFAVKMALVVRSASRMLLFFLMMLATLALTGW